MVYDPTAFVQYPMTGVDNLPITHETPVYTLCKEYLDYWKRLKILTYFMFVHADEMGKANINLII